MKWTCKLILIGLILVLILFVVLVFLSYVASEARPLKKPIVSEEVHYYHFSREILNGSIELKTGEKLFESINPKLPWKFFIHGWGMSPSNTPGLLTGKDAYLHKGEYNVVFVDWSKLANHPYLESATNAMVAGRTFGKFIIHLYQNGVSLDDIHLIGHSLGSHMAGSAGKYVRDNLNKIGRITGLDPARTMFESRPGQFSLVPEKFRLSIEDANFVDVIHTDAAHYGILSSFGHCDFFPNSGKPPQPGCEKYTEEKDVDDCSHNRSIEIFAESINLNNFVAKECSSYEDFKNDKCKNGSTAVMGEHTDSNTRGIFFLETNSSPPFGLGII